MLLDFYGLREQPFGVTPDPRFLYLGASHREALASLCYGVKMNRGLVALVAPPGMGKTTLLFRLLEHLQQSARTAFLFQTQCDSNGLLHYILNDLGINTRGQNFIGMHQQLNSLLVEEARAGRRFVVVIDEAQNLDEEVLETARLLTDFETPNQKLLQIVLAGQPQLADKLKRPELIQLRQRISTVGRLGPLRLHEVNEYINHRLRVASCGSAPIFSPSAICNIYAASEGVPRNINNLCFNAMSLGCALRAKKIDGDLISEAAKDLDLEMPLDPLLRPLAPLPLISTVTTKREKRVDRIEIRQTIPTLTESSQTDISAVRSNEQKERIESRATHSDGGSGAERGLTELVVEPFEVAIARNAEILAEVINVSQKNEVEFTAPLFENEPITAPAPLPANPVWSPVARINADTLPVKSGPIDPAVGKPRRERKRFYSATWIASRRRFSKSAALLVLGLAGFYYRLEIGNAAIEIREVVTVGVIHVVSFAGSVITPSRNSETQDRNTDRESTRSDPVSR